MSECESSIFSNLHRTLCTGCTFCTIYTYLLHLLYVLGYDLYVPSECTVPNERTILGLLGPKFLRLFYIVRLFVNITWPRFFIT